MRETGRRTQGSRHWLAGAVLLSALLGAAAPASATFLTGGIEFDSDTSGGFTNNDVWNTLGGDGDFNLYLRRAGTFLNSGNAAAARPNLSLTPGTYIIDLFGEPGSAQPNFALNLFFNGDDTNPGISVFAPEQDAPAAPPFQVNTDTNTLALNGTGNVQASNTLAFIDGPTTVTLTDYRWAQPPVFPTNAVSAFDNVPNGTNDFVGQITLNVTGPAVGGATPEPGTLALMGAGLTALWRFGRRRRAR